MKTKSKKSAAPRKQTVPSQAEMWSAALDHENEGNWAAAATVWGELAKMGSRKERSDAAGRAAAARVRAEAKLEQPAPAPEPETAQPEPTTPAPDAGAAPAHEPANDATPAPDAPPVKPKRARAAKQPTAPVRDERLPAVGTVVQKRDRQGAVRCECTIAENGVFYSGTTYKSLSAAALAASKGLGLTSKTLDGWAWWGIKTRTASASKKDVIGSLTKAWEKYRERAAKAVETASDDERAKIHEAVNAHAKTLIEMVGAVI